jgi:hypothetical protein
LDHWVKETILATFSETGSVGRDEAGPRVTVSEFERDVVGSLRGSFDLARGFPDSNAWLVTVRSVAEGLERELAKLNALVPYPKLTDRPKNLLDGFMVFLDSLRNYRMPVPADLRPTLGMGAAGGTVERS